MQTFSLIIRATHILVSQKMIALQNIVLIPEDVNIRSSSKTNNFSDSSDTLSEHETQGAGERSL